MTQNIFFSHFFLKTKKIICFQFLTKKIKILIRFCANVKIATLDFIFIYLLHVINYNNLFISTSHPSNVCLFDVEVVVGGTLVQSRTE